MGHIAVLSESSKDKATNRAWQRVLKALSGLAFVALLIYCAAGAISVNVWSMRMLPNQLDNTIPEGAYAYLALHSAETGQLYFSFRQPPHIVQAYGPLFYALTAGIARLSHLNLHLTVQRIRMACYLSYLASALLVLVICRKLACSIPLSFLAVLMMLGQHDFLGWNVTVRPDMMMLLFMLLSLFFAMYMDKRPWLLCGLSGVSAGLAFLIKQPGVGVAFAIVLVLLYKKEYLRAVVLSVAAAIPVIVMLMSLVWHEKHFVEQFTSLGKCVWSLKEGTHYLLQTASRLVYIVPAVIGSVGLTRAVRMSTSWQMVVSFTLTSGLVALAGLPQLGSTSNYFIPALVGCALLLPPAVEAFGRWRYLPAAAVLIIPVLLGASYSRNYIGHVYLDYFNSPHVSSYAPLRSFRVISDVPLLSMQGREPELLDAFSIHSIELTGNWAASSVVEDVRQGKFDLVVLMHATPHVVYYPRVEFYRMTESWRGISDISPVIVSALNENYEVLCASPFSVVLKPKNRSVTISTDFFRPLFRWNRIEDAAGTPPRLVTVENVRSAENGR